LQEKPIVTSLKKSLIVKKFQGLRAVVSRAQLFARRARKSRKQEFIKKTGYKTLRAGSFELVIALVPGIWIWRQRAQLSNF